jgi:hypothetical protein
MKKLSELSEKISKYLLAAILIIVPLFPKFPLIGVSGTYVAIRAEDLLLLALAIILIPKVILDFKKLIRDPIFIAFLIFLASGILSTIAGAFLTQTVAFVIGIFHWARRIEYITPFFAAYLLIPKDKIVENIEFYVKILLIVVSVAFVYGFGQRYFQFPVIITQNEQYSKGIALLWTPGSHINSTFAGHYDLAAFMVMVMPIFFAAMFLIKDKISRFLLIAVSGAGLWLLINSISRIAQVSYILAVSTALLLIKKFKGLALVLVLSVFFMAMSSGLDMRFYSAIHAIYERIAIGKSFSYVENHFVALADQITLPANAGNVPVPTATPVPALQDVSIAIRVNVEWPRAIRAFLKNPLLGTGYSSIDLATDNDFLRMLGETGLIGLFSFGLIFLRIGEVFKGAFPLNKKLSWMELAFFVGLLGAFIGTITTAFFIDLFEASKFAIIFWLLMGCAVNLVKSKNYAE